MGGYRPRLAALSYLFGVVAVIAALTDDGENDLYTFHVWQALLVNVALGVLAAVGAGLLLPRLIILLPAAQRASALLIAIVGLIAGLLLVLAYPAHRAYHRQDLRIPGVAPAAERLARTAA